MNKKQFQSGSSHLIIIIAAVVLILGALGFLYWQNWQKSVLDKEAADKAVVVAELASKKKYTNIDKWSVKGSYIGDDIAIKDFSGFPGNGIYFESDLLKNLPDCSPMDELKVVARYHKDDQASVIAVFGDNSFLDTAAMTVEDFFVKYPEWLGSAKLVGDYYYAISKPVSVCGTGGDDAVSIEQTRINGLTSQYFNSLEKI